MGLGVIKSLVVPAVLSGIAEVLAYNVQILHFEDYYGDKSNSESKDHQIRPSISIYYPGESVDSDVNNDDATLDTWSVVWYIASFGGLIVFFLIVSCSEWCCRRNARRNFSRTSNVQTVTPIVPDTPPPSYDQFAPPDYESICYKMPGTSGRSEKSEYDIYVVPVHSFGTIMEDARRSEEGTNNNKHDEDDAPPSYQSAFQSLQGSTNVPMVLQTPPARRSRNSSTIMLDPRNLGGSHIQLSETVTSQSESSFSPAVPPQNASTQVQGTSISSSIHSGNVQASSTT